MHALYELAKELLVHWSASLPGNVSSIVRQWLSASMAHSGLHGSAHWSASGKTPKKNPSHGGAWSECELEGGLATERRIPTLHPLDPFILPYGTLVSLFGLERLEVPAVELTERIECPTVAGACALPRRCSFHGVRC